MTNAGIVKIAPATSASPTEAVVREMFSSSTDPPPSRRNAAMATTAAGNVAATVNPAFMPRYALAAPSTIAIVTPSATARNVISGRSVSSGTNGVKPDRGLSDVLMIGVAPESPARADRLYKRNRCADATVAALSEREAGCYARSNRPARP